MDFDQNLLALLKDVLLISALILFIAGSFFFFVPALLVKWNTVGNTWLGPGDDAHRSGVWRRIISADYAIFRNHRITGGVMWGLSSFFLIIYTLYR